MKRELELGCDIDNHSWSHSNMTTLTAEQIKKEIEDTSNIIHDTVGVTPQFFRPPFILINDVMYDNIELPFICGINCLDWDASVTSEQRAEAILANAKDGDIILVHDFKDNYNTVNALDDIIQGLKDKGFVFVTISKLFELKGVDPKVRNKIWTNTAD
jgi:peptidoglycan/xylan/chitin deacetylase (PgdA/CDA1 family)